MTLAAELVPDLRERKLLELIYQWRANRVRSIKDTCRWLTEEGIGCGFGGGNRGGLSI